MIYLSFHLLFIYNELIKHILTKKVYLYKIDTSWDWQKDYFSSVFKNLSKGIDVESTWVFYIDKNIIQKNNNTNIKFFGQDLIYIILKIGQRIGKRKKYYLAIQISISSLESRI